MAVKSTKSRVSKSSSKKSGFKFRWWMGLGLVVLVALVGVLVIRFSRAGAIVLANPGNCPRGVLTQAHSKGAATTSNVCVHTAARGNYVQTPVNINPGGVGTYCAWGRYVGDVYLSIGVSAGNDGYSGSYVGGRVEHPNPADSNVQGFGSTWSSTPNAAAPGGGSQLLACVRARTTSINMINYEHRGGSGFILWDYVTVSDIQ